MVVAINIVRSSLFRACFVGSHPAQAWPRRSLALLPSSPAYRAAAAVAATATAAVSTTIPSSCTSLKDTPSPTTTNPPADRQDDTPTVVPTGDTHGSVATQSSHSHVASFKILAKARNNAPWTPEDDRKLVTLRSQGCTWGSIASILSRHRTACSRRYDQLSMNGSTSEVAELETATSQIEPVFADHPSNCDLLLRLVSQGTSWTQIGRTFGLRANVCQIQWRRLRKQMESSPADESTTPDDDRLETGSLDHQRKKSTSTSRKDLVLALAQAVQDHGLDQWEVISQQAFDGKFSPEWLRHQYMRHEQERSKWTKQEDLQLLSAVQAALGPLAASHSTDLTPSQWEAIASEYGGRQRTVDECLRRWRKLRLTKASDGNADINSSSLTSASRKTKTDKYVVWTGEASARLESLVSTCSKDEKGKRLIDWLKVEDGMKPYGYSKLQCKARWNRIIRTSALSSAAPAVTPSSTVTIASSANESSTSIERAVGRPWGQQEIEALMCGVADLGDGAWAKIQRKYLPHRIDKGIQGKWNSIMRKILRESFVNLTSIEYEAERMYGVMARKDLEQITIKWPLLISKAKERLSLENKIKL